MNLLDHDVPDGFRFIRSISVDGNGAVALVTDLLSNKQVVLKRVSERLLLSRTAVRRFQREIDILQSIRHPRIVSYVSSGEDEYGAWYTTDYCPAGSLQSRHKQSGLTTSQAVTATINILHGLVFLHEYDLGPEQQRGPIIHRDIKPDNVFMASLSPDNLETQIADFGLARALNAATGGTVTSTRDKYGTFAFISRAQLEDFHDCGPAADVWSAAATLYYLLTDDYPRDFVSDLQSPDWVLANRNARPIRILNKNVPVDLAEIIDEALREPGFTNGPGHSTSILDAQQLCQHLTRWKRDSGLL